MRRFRYDTSNNWYKGNTHVHSTASDGGMDFTQLSELYAGAGYDFLFRMDHSVSSDVEADTNDYPLLWLDGVELGGADHDGSSYHISCLGKVSGVEGQNGLMPNLELAREQGAILILAHPALLSNSIDEALRHGFDGVEIYNHVAHWINGRSNSMFHWSMMLDHFPNTFALASDDTHCDAVCPGWNGGWIVVNAAECTRPAIMEAIRCGNFYASCGPDFRSIKCEGNQITATTSPIQFARVVGPGWNSDRTGSFDGETFTEVTFEVPEDWGYAYLEIEDAQGKRAWTNPLFVAEG